MRHLKACAARIALPEVRIRGDATGSRSPVEGVRDHGRWRKLMRISRLSAQSSSRVGRMVPGSWG